MSKNSLFNRKNKMQLREQQENEIFNRNTCSFYRYIKISNPEAMRNILYKEFSSLDILGRIYIAKEGINAQLCVPETNWDLFLRTLNLHQEFTKMFIKQAVIESNKSFLKLIVKVKNRIVADGLSEESFDSSNVGKKLNAKEFNIAMNDPDTIVVDMRNYYESEVGHFENAICPDVDTFKDSLPIVKKQLENKQDKKILLYCTGGIRCEKASAYLRHHNFKDVNQLDGGIIEYSHQIKTENINSKFKGKNFVFDYRMCEAITNDIISKCHQCESSSDTHTNCNNQACHILFIQCKNCKEIYSGCCSFECKNIAQLTIEEQRIMRKTPQKAAPLKQFQKRVKPKLKDLIIERQKTI